MTESGFPAACPVDDEKGFSGKSVRFRFLRSVLFLVYVLPAIYEIFLCTSQASAAAAHPVVKTGTPPIEVYFNAHDIAAGAAYGHAIRCCLLLSLASSLLILTAMLWTQAGIRFRLWTSIISDGRPWMMSLLMGAGAFTVLSLARLPIDFYRGYLLQHRFGLSTQNKSSWLADWLLSTSIDGVVFLSAVLVVYALIMRFPRTWWLPAWLAASVFTVVTVYLSPVVLDPLFNDFRPLRRAGLCKRLTALAHEAGVPLDEILVMDASRRTRKANAYYTGIGATRRIVLYDTLLDRFSEDEVVSVVAHELGHWIHRHVLQGTVLAIAGLFLLFVVLFRVLTMVCERDWFGLRDPADPANLPLLLLVVTVAQFASLPIGCALSRSMERQADLAALKLTNDPAAFIEVERKLARMNVSDLDPPAWAVSMFYTHPPVMQRIAMALSFRNTRGKTGQSGMTYSSPHDRTPQGRPSSAPLSYASP